MWRTADWHPSSVIARLRTPSRPPQYPLIDENGRVKRIDADLRTVFAAERLRMISQIDSLQQRFGDIVASAELTSTDDEHDPEGATIAYERAQVSALLRQARLDLVALDEAAALIDDGTVSLCSACGGLIVIERLLALPGVRTCINCAR